MLGSRWTSWIGLRYLRSKKSLKLLNLITVLSFLGVTLGVAATIIVLSVMDGFERELKKRLFASDLHVLVTPLPTYPGFEGGFIPEGSSFNQPEVEQILNSQAVEGVYPMVTTEAILRTRTKVMGVVVKGIDNTRMNRLNAQMTEVADSRLLVDRDGLEDMKYAKLYLGQEMAYELGLIPGDQVTLISPTETEGPLSQVPRLKKFVVAGIYRSGLPDQELHVVFTAQQEVRSFLRRKDVVSQWEITVKDLEQAPGIADRLRPHLAHLRVQDWVQMNAHLFYSLKLERVAMFFVMAIIIVVASFNIITTLSMMVMEKRREIAILRTMGALETEVSAIFLSQGLIVGGTGVAGGVALAFGVCWVLAKTNFIQLPDLYYDRSLPVTFNGLYYLIASGTTFIIVVLACYLPARRAARLKPLDAIR